MPPTMYDFADRSSLSILFLFQFKALHDASTQIVSGDTSANAAKAHFKLALFCDDQLKILETKEQPATKEVLYGHQ